MSLIDRHNAWLFDGYRTSLANLAVVRILLALAFLLGAVPCGMWVIDLPDAMLDSVPSPMALLIDGFPSATTMWLLNGLLTVCLLMLLVGLYTPVVSVLSTVGIITLESINMTTGKIDHSILWDIMPMMFAFSGWGRCWSTDALRSGRERLPSPDLLKETDHWCLTLWAVIIAAAISTAGLIKIRGHWLDIEQSSTLGFLMYSDLILHRSTPISEWLIVTIPAWLWEVSDYLTVLLELGGLLLVFKQRYFVAWLFILTMFHLGVGVMIDIWFVPNILAYAIFVAWVSSANPWSRWSHRKVVLSLLALFPVLLAFVFWKGWAYPQQYSLIMTLVDWIAVAVVNLGVVVALALAWRHWMRSRRA